MTKGQKVGTRRVPAVIGDEPESFNEQPFVYDGLRRTLADLVPIGEQGFEGLVASAFSALAGVPFRLVKSGRQFGRDGEAVIEGAAIMFEAKRYTSRLSYDQLSVKLVEAVERSGRTIEVWTVAATVPLDAADAGDLKKMGEDRGVTVLLLDWTSPLPELAILLAAADSVARDWFVRNAPDKHELVKGALSDVRRDSLYNSRRQRLVSELTASTLGLAMARQGNAAWLTGRFSDERAALMAFNQPLAPLDGNRRPRAIERTALEARTRDALLNRPGTPEVVVLTGDAGGQAAGALEGDEGVGKTWAVARAWLTMENTQLAPRPLLLIMASHMWRDGDEERPIAVLARLLASQCGSGLATPDNENRWMSRLGRWFDIATAPRIRPAIIVVLDGVNERDQRWAALIAGLVELGRDRPLRVAITTRRASYARNLAPRLTLLETRIITVEAFSDDDLDAVLRREGRDPSTVKDPLRRFLRNPRILSVGVGLLDRLDTVDVGVERLLFEYLVKRQEERALHASLTRDQLVETLTAHVRAIRERLLHQRPAREAQVFDGADSARFLSAPPGGLLAGLGEIIDSQFMQLLDARRGRYRFTTQARLLGLGLLIVDELEQAVQTNPDADLAALLDEIIDPIRAIDETANLLLAALDVSLADLAINDLVAEELLFSLLVLQNVREADRTRVCAGLRQRPSVYISATERLFGLEEARGRRDWMMHALADRRSDPLVEATLDEAIRRWLRSWQPTPTPPNLTGYPDEQSEMARRQHAESAEQHNAALASLTAIERSYIDSELKPLPTGWRAGVSEVAINLLVGRPLAPFADDLFAWAVAAAAGWHASGFEDMHWLQRLAPIDWEATSAAVGLLSDQYCGPERSTTFGWACDIAWNSSGDPEQATRAEIAWPLLHDGPRRIVHSGWDQDCDVDPLDPAAPGPSGNLETIRQRYRDWCEGESRGHILLRHADSPAGRTRQILCRFDIDWVVDRHIAVARNAPEIVGVTSAVVAGFIAHDAAILGRPEAEILLAWLRILRTRGPLQHKDRNVPALLLHIVLPHLSPREQFEALATTIGDEPIPLWLETHLLPLPDDELTARLRDAATEEPVRFRNALFFAGARPAASEGVRRMVAEGLDHDDPRVRGMALRTMLRAGTYDDRAAFAARSWRWSGSTDGTNAGMDFCASLCLAQVLGPNDDASLLDRIHPVQWGGAVLRSGPVVAGATADRILSALRAAGEARPPEGITVSCRRADEAPDRVSELAGIDVTISFAMNPHINAASVPRPAPDMRAFLAYEQRAHDAGLGCLIYPPSSAALDRIAAMAPDAFNRIVAHVEGAEGSVLDGAVVIASDVARILSRTDGARAGKLFARYERVTPIIFEDMPLSGVPKPILLLWLAEDVPEIIEARTRRLDRAMSDDVLADHAVAAALAGKSGRMAAYIVDRSRSRHPAAMARALTLAGFAAPNRCFTDLFADTRFAHGFLSDVREHAMTAHRHGLWARQWNDRALAAQAAADTWRYGELGAACVDGRCALWFGKRIGSPRYERLRPFFRSILEHGSEEARRNRKRKLFGERSPPDSFRQDEAALM